MSRQVFIHVGLPKTGTTYLQSIAWAHRDALRDLGVLLPGTGPREHLWASCAVREEPRLKRRHPDAPLAWTRLAAELRDWPEVGLVTHEFFAGASADQVGRALAELGDAEVHVVVTTRELVSLVTAYWQEWVKNGATGAIDDFPAREGYDPGDEWGWGTIDLADVLARWGTHVPPERIHVICPAEAGAPPDDLWRRFAGVVGFDPAVADPSGGRAYASLGIVAVELLRRINPQLRLERPVDRGVWVRGYLAHERLAAHGSERFWPRPERVAALRERSRAGLSRVAGRGYDVVGSLERLRTPDELEPRRHPGSVTDAELLEVATATIAEMVDDLRTRTAHAAPTPPPADAADQAPSAAGLARRAAGVLRRVRR